MISPKALFVSAKKTSAFNSVCPYHMQIFSWNTAPKPKYIIPVVSHYIQTCYYSIAIVTKKAAPLAMPRQKA